jgi:hypothetical protein
MLGMTVVMLLHASDPTLAPAARYELMSRAELQSAYDDLEAKRPGIGLPLTGILVGAAGVVISFVVFWVNFTTPYGLAVYSAVTLMGAFLVSAAMIIGSIALWSHRRPERDAIGRHLQEIEDAYREGRCRSVAGQRPCAKDPSGPPPTRDGFVPQVSAPGPVPSLVVARF